MYLDVDSCAYAEPLETFLDRALVICPQLLLHAIRSMSWSSRLSVPPAVERRMRSQHGERWRVAALPYVRV